MGGGGNDRGDMNRGKGTGGKIECPRGEVTGENGGEYRGEAA